MVDEVKKGSLDNTGHSVSINVFSKSLVSDNAKISEIVIEAISKLKEREMDLGLYTISEHTTPENDGFIVYEWKNLGTKEECISIVDELAAHIGDEIDSYLNVTDIFGVVAYSRTGESSTADERPKTDQEKIESLKPLANIFNGLRDFFKSKQKPEDSVSHYLDAHAEYIVICRSCGWEKLLSVPCRHHFCGSCNSTDLVYENITSDTIRDMSPVTLDMVQKLRDLADQLEHTYNGTDTSVVEVTLNHNCGLVSTTIRTTEKLPKENEDV